MNKKNISVKKISNFKPQLRSQHPTHKWLRANLPSLPVRSVVRLGSTTDFTDTIERGGKRIEINTVDSVVNSSNKKLMKECFDEAGVKTANWFSVTTQRELLAQAREITDNWKKRLVMKNIHGSRGRGNYLIKSEGELKEWSINRNLSNYIGEAFFTGMREYRLHVTKNGCFYTCRKVLKADTPEDKKWYRNDSNCNWLIEDNEEFDKPVNWDIIVADCVKALKALGGDIMGFDVKVQDTTDSKGKKRDNPDFIIIESNSACSHGNITRVKYSEIIPKLIKEKAKL